MGDSTVPRSKSLTGEFSAFRLLAFTLLALAVSVALTGVKFWGWTITGSQAVYSDFMESIANIVAGALVVFVVRLAARPPDRSHPFGHGKVEYFSAAFEGGMIAFAACVIFLEAVPALFVPGETKELGLGAGIVFGCGLVNLVLGTALKRVGSKVGSPALVANGEHIRSDFVTSAGVTVGLGLAHFTGIGWLDPAIAILVGLQLAWTGGRVVRRSVGGLMDEEDRELLMELASCVQRLRAEDGRGAAGVSKSFEVIQIHHTRAIRSGRFHHIDAHAVIPEFWNVAEAHDRVEDFERRLLKLYSQPGELHLHVDPCRRVYCRHCDVPECPLRLRPFESYLPCDLESLTNPDEPARFKKS
ncbi:MAG: cation diffusion facilitator family transporter [Bdellovibrionales bacterium]|jgi:cation diffusion facilitator family transporter|nr:cation diffusion facilitator family transporter [Bdellovibrionales bacterium]